MSDNDSDDEIDVKDLKDEVQMLRRWNVRHNAKIEEIRDDIRYIRGKIRELETGNTGNHNRRSRRGNIRNRPARTGGGRRTRRGRRKKRTRRRRKPRRKSKGRKRRKSRRKSRRRRR